MAPPAPAELRRYGLFGGLFDPQLERIAARIRTEELAEGTALIREGELGDRLYCLVTGEVEVLRQEHDGVQAVVARLGPGQTIGEMELIDMQPRSATVVALTGCTAHSLALRDLLALQREDPPAFTTIVLNLARDLSRRLRRMDATLVGRFEG